MASRLTVTTGRYEALRGDNRATISGGHVAVAEVSRSFSGRTSDYFPGPTS